MTQSSTIKLPDVDSVWHFRHDVFNMVFLPCLLFFNINVFLDWNLANFAFYTKVFIFYILTDSIWVFLIPRSVASPATILIHHAAALAGLVSVLSMSSDYIIIGAAAGLLEINTFFLLARRNFRSSSIINILFFSSWVVIRLLLGPWLLYKTISLFLTHFELFMNEPILLLQASIIVIVTLGLNILNFKWSYDLVAKQIIRKEGLSKGL